MDVVTITLSPAEREVLEQLRAAGRFLSDEDVVRSAVFSLAMHYGLAPHHDVFALSSGRKRKASA